MKRELLKCSSESEVGEKCEGGGGDESERFPRGGGGGRCYCHPLPPHAAREGGG